MSLKRTLVKFLSALYSPKANDFFRKLSESVISEKEKRLFKSCGEKFVLHTGFNICGEKYICIGDGFCAHENLIMQCFDKYDCSVYEPSLKIGKRAYFGANCHIGCIGNITIGDNLTCGRNVLIIDHDHGQGTIEEGSIHPLDRPLVRKGDIKIGNNVWLGENCVVLSGVIIGDNVTVGANSVVTKDIPGNCIVGGIPAKIIREKM
ncbi:MAG: acyltransferase [Clostridia bacterium]|nr:acyltransferase [Clostridia bacterium]